MKNGWKTCKFLGYQAMLNLVQAIGYRDNGNAITAAQLKQLMNCRFGIPFTPFLRVRKIMLPEHMRHYYDIFL